MLSQLNFRFLGYAFSILISFGVAQSVAAKPQVLSHMSDLESTLEKKLKTVTPEDVLIAFDIDMTLTQPDHPAAFYPNIKKHAKQYRSITAQLTPAQKDCVATLSTQVVPQRLVDEKTPEIISGLQQKGYKTIALTASLTGKFLDFPTKVIFLRRDQLFNRGFDFSKALKQYTRVLPMIDLPKHANYYPIFYQGILASNGEKKVSKGKVLARLLKNIGKNYELKARRPGFYPKVVVMVDDKAQHLDNIEKALAIYDPNIQFIGLQYTGAYRYAPKKISQPDFIAFWQGLADKSRQAFPKTL